MSAVIDDLPDEVLAVILSRFDPLEKLRLRAVCSRWKLIIESFRIEDVSIIDTNFNRRDFSSYLGLEFLNCQSLIYSNPSLYRWIIGTIRLTMPESLQFVRDNPMFAGLKSMYLSFESINNFSFEKYINPHFPQLERLTCFGLSLGKTCLSLANLKVLSLQPLANAPIRLDLPSMYQLSTDLSLDAFEFVHPQTVTHLILPYDHESIARLANLEYFFCSRLVHESVTLSNLTKLKEIHVGYWEYQKNTERRLAEIYAVKERLGRHDLKVFANGLDYEALRDNPTFSIKEAIHSILSRTRSSPFPIIYQIMSNGQIPWSQIPWSQKSGLSTIRSISTLRIERSEINSFFRVLDDCPNLFVLHLAEAFDGLSDKQTCYNRLPSHCRFLRELWLHVSSDRPNPIDLNFVLGFRYLQTLITNQRLVPSDLIASLFGKLNYFRVLELKKKYPIKITKKADLRSTMYVLSHRGVEETFYDDFLYRNFSHLNNLNRLLLKVQISCIDEVMSEMAGRTLQLFPRR